MTGLRACTIIQDEEGKGRGWKKGGKVGEGEKCWRGEVKGFWGGRCQAECKVTALRLPAQCQQAAVGKMVCMYRGGSLRSVHAPGIPILADRPHVGCGETGAVGNPTDAGSSGDSRRQGGGDDGIADWRVRNAIRRSGRTSRCD